jgi:hypothetical protein
VDEIMAKGARSGGTLRERRAEGPWGCAAGSLAQAFARTCAHRATDRADLRRLAAPSPRGDLRKSRIDARALGGGLRSTGNRAAPGFRARPLRWAFPLAMTSEEDLMGRTMKTTMMVLSLCVAGMTTVGCGGAGLSLAHHGTGGVSIVRRGAFSGELVLTGSVIDSHYEAETMMLEHCEGRVQIVDAAVGAELSVSDAAIGAAKSDGAISGERVHYLCVTRAAAARR